MGRHRSRNSFKRQELEQYGEQTVEENSSIIAEDDTDPFQDSFMQTNLEVLKEIDGSSFSTLPIKQETNTISTYNFRGKIFYAGQEAQSLEFLYNHVAIDYVVVPDLSKTNYSNLFSDSFETIVRKYFRSTDKTYDFLLDISNQYIKKHLLEREKDLKYKTFLIVMSYVTDKLFIFHNNQKINFASPYEMLDKLSKKDYVLTPSFIEKYADVLYFYYFKNLGESTLVESEYCDALSKEVYKKHDVLVSLSAKTGKTYFGRREEIETLLDKNDFVSEKYHVVLGADETYKRKVQSLLASINLENRAELRDVMSHFVYPSSLVGEYVSLLYIKISMMNSNIFTLTTCNEKKECNLIFDSKTIFDELCMLSSKYIRNQIDSNSLESRKLDVIYLFLKNGIFGGMFSSLASQQLNVGSNLTLKDLAKNKSLDDFCLSIFDATNDRYISCGSTYLTYEELINMMKNDQAKDKTASSLAFLAELSVYMNDNNFFKTLCQVFGKTVDVIKISQNIKDKIHMIETK